MNKSKIVLLVICIIVFLLSSAFVLKNVISDIKNQKMYDDLSNLVVETTNEADGEEVTHAPDYSAVITENADFVGWITVPNTSINYPVLQTDDNDFYLTHGFYKAKDSRGAIFMDYRNNPIDLDANTIIYGHNCYNTTMFSELTKFEKLDFYKTTPIIEFNTVERKYQWKIYGVFITNALPEEDNGYVFNYIYPDMDGENFEGFIEEVNKRRLYVTDVDIKSDDKMLVLSTCVRNLDIYENGRRTYKADTRLVVLARAVRDGESDEVNVNGAYVNTDPKYPQLWYDKNNKSNPYINDEKWYPKEVVTE